MKRVERGMDYDSYSKDTFIHQEQTILFRRWLEEVAINEECITFQHTITITNSLVVKRRTDILTTHSRLLYQTHKIGLFFPLFC